MKSQVGQSKNIQRRRDNQRRAKQQKPEDRSRDSRWRGSQTSARSHYWSASVRYGRYGSSWSPSVLFAARLVGVTFYVSYSCDYYYEHDYSATTNFEYVVEHVMAFYW